MSLRTLFWPVLGLSLFAACVHARFTLDELPDDQLRFGSGGGFAGAYKEYLLLDNGQVFLFEFGPAKKDTFELQSLTRQETKMVFKELDSLRLQKYDFNYPGNMSYYVRLSDEQTEHSVQWGDPRWTVRPDIAEFHSELKSLMDNRKVIFNPKVAREKPKESEIW